MSRLAAIDIGTNSVLLTVAELREHAGRRELSTLVERARITRLGEGVDRSRQIAPAAAERTLACLRDYAGELRALGVGELAVVGTSALRDAGGGGAFIESAAELLGARPRVIDGSEEAELTFAGALSGLAVGGDVCVFDVGGGSTEVIRGSVTPGARRIDTSVSLDIGSVRLFERHGGDDPPDDAHIESARADIESALGGERPAASAMTLVGVAGTVTTLAAIAQRLADYDPARVHGARLDRAVVERLFDELRREPLAVRRARAGLDPARADVIVFGALIVCSVMSWAGASELVVSDRGVRWGLLERLAGKSAGFSAS